MVWKFKTEEDALKAVKRHKLVPNARKDEEMWLNAVKFNGQALMFVPVQLRTIEVCKAALETDKDAMAYVPEDMKWLLTAMEGYLLTVHCDTKSWQVEVTDIG